MLVEENKPLAPLTTLGVGGPARWFIAADTEAEIVAASAFARERQVPLFVLGSGSNLLVADTGFDGLVLHVALKEVRVNDSEAAAPPARIYQVAAGEDWDRFVERTVDDDCAGLECLAGIPGTVGGTPVQNVGAYGQEVATVIERVRVLDLAERTFTEFTNAECGFGYRQSRFNTSDKGRYIVTRVDYQLRAGGAPTLKYADLQRAFSSHSNPGLKEVAETVRRIRNSKGMLLVENDPDCRSAGSFFKNPIVATSVADAAAAICGEEPPRFPAGPGHDGLVKIPAAWLIERAGFTKGFTMGKAGISHKHTLALVNRGGATAEDIMALAAGICTAVAERFAIRLQMEPVTLGFDQH